MISDPIHSDLIRWYCIRYDMIGFDIDDIRSDPIQYISSDHTISDLIQWYQIRSDWIWYWLSDPIKLDLILMISDRWYQTKSDRIWYQWCQVRSDQIWHQWYHRLHQIRLDIDDIKLDLIWSDISHIDPISSNLTSMISDLIWSDLIPMVSDWIRSDLISSMSDRIWYQCDIGSN